MFTFATDYYLCVLIAAIGVLQIAFSIGKIRGLLIFKSPIIARGGGLALAVARQESSMNTRAESSAGARGIMQLMPATAQTVARWLRVP